MLAVRFLNRVDKRRIKHNTKKMKTKIKITIEGNTFEVESTYENGVDNIIKVIEVITKQ